VATMDTITLIRSAIRNLLRVADKLLAAELRSVLISGDEYASASKPQIDWDDKAAQAELVNSRAHDGYAALVLLDGRELDPAVEEAAALLATVLGQDLEATEDGTFSIARRVAPDRVISTVDPETRHGHKTSAHGFDGFKGHGDRPGLRDHHRNRRLFGQRWRRERRRGTDRRSPRGRRAGQGWRGR